ncbi:MAG: TonB-dependent receptor domain-containing protein [Acidobacteriota bacterium]
MTRPSGNSPLFRRVFISLCVALLLTGIVLVETQAQVLYGTIVGNVIDTSQSAVPGATVTVTNLETNQVRETLTNEGGAYTFSTVHPGNYTVKVSLPGFKEFSQAVAVTLNNVTRVDATLEIGTLAETVTVAAQSASLQTDKTDVHTELSSKEVTDLPIGIYRNYQSLIDLVPGATPAQFQNAVTDTPARGLTTNINGTARNSNNTRLDGATTVLTWLPHHVSYVAPQESIQTVSISTNNFDAEQGLAGGAAITVQTKSGTNRLHGVGFGYHNNHILRAKPFFIPKGSDVPKNLLTMYGGTLGGAIKKDKLFFFTSWEAMRERQNFSRLVTVPTALHRTGNFGDVTGLNLYDPLTGNLDGSGRTAFTNRTIPENRISLSSKKLLALIPLPNLPGTSSNYYASAPQVFDRDNYDFKIDWVRSTKSTVWGKYSLMNAPVRCEFSLAGAGGNALCDGGNGLGETRVQLAVLGSSYVVSPRFLVDGTVGYSRYAHRTRGADYGTNFGSEVLGIPGTNGPDPRQSGIPIFAISGYETLGNTNTWSPVDRKDNSWTYTGNASWSKDRHDIRFGADIARQHMNHWQPELGGRSPRGNFRYTGGVTSLRGGAASGRFNALAQFMLGLPNELGTALQFYDPMTTREWLHGLYFRDRWQATRNLTLTLGLRWEYYPMMTRSNTGIERYDLELNKVFIGRKGGVDDNVGVTASKKNFAPRIGLAYRLADKSVIRSGYGITIDPYPSARPLRSPYPVVIFSDHEGPNSFQPFGRIEDGIPRLVGPDISKGIIDIPPTIGTRTVEKGEFKRGYIQSWNLIYERELPLNMVGSVGYVGTRSIRQFATLELNVAPPGGGAAGRELFKKFGRTASTSLHSPWNTSDYNSLQASLNRRFRDGLFVKTVYTWSKAINFNDDSGEGCCIFMHPSVRSRQRAVAGYDRTHIFRSAWIYELPLGPNKRWAQGGVAGAVLGGWQMNAIFSAVSGRPFTVSASGTSLNAPGGNSQVADQVLPEVKKLGGIGRDNPYFDPLAFRPVTEVRFGNSGRNSLRGPGLLNLDLGIFRSFKVTEDVEMQFRAEAFNFTNTPHFNNPSASASDLRLNLDGSLLSNNGFFGITSARPDERNFRFGLRVSF